MTDIQAAAKSALRFYKTLYPDVAGELIEEVELDSTGQYWLITLSFPDDEALKSADVFLPQRIERKYKTFKIDRQTGDVLSMKIRELAR